MALRRFLAMRQAATSLQGVPARRAAAPNFRRRLGDTPAPGISANPIGPALPPALVATGQMDIQTLYQYRLAAGQNSKDKPPQPPAQDSSVMSYAMIVGGVAVGAGLLVALTKTLGRKVGKPIPGAHVYEGL
jgi:hypothetical protein